MRSGRLAVKALAIAVDPLFGRLLGPRILIYHQVGVELGREMEVSTEAFTRQLDWMQQHGEVVDLETALDRSGESGAERLFVLTFDDGFEDVYRNAFPLLQERELPFTLYLTTNPIETGEPLASGYPEAKPLTWTQVNEMHDTGLATVGAHTHSHPDLRGLSIAEISKELDTSNRLIEVSTGVVPQHFTYPWGWWSEAADQLVRDRYKTATLGAGTAIGPASDRVRLNRIPVQKSDGSRLFGRKFSSGAPLENRVRRYVAKYDGP